MLQWRSGNFLRSLQADRKLLELPLVDGDPIRLGGQWPNPAKPPRPVLLVADTDPRLARERLGVGLLDGPRVPRLTFPPNRGGMSYKE